MKKYFILMAVFLLVLMGCDSGNSTDNENNNQNGNNGTSKAIFTISNQSSYELYDVEYNSMDFGPIRIGWDATEKIYAGTKYIYFTLIFPPKTAWDDAIYVRCRTANAITCEENVINTFVFTNNTVIKTVNINPEIEGTLGNIAYELSK
jgi:hypothetical protein